MREHERIERRLDSTKGDPVAKYDPGDPAVPIPFHWAQMADTTAAASWRQRTQRSSYLAAAATFMYGMPPALIGGRLWSPEQELPVEEQRLITPQEFRSSPVVIQVDARLLRALDEQPERLLSLTARQFEEFVADLLKRLGYRAALSPKGRDGGIDIVADRTTDVGPELVLVQCKRFATKKVDEPTVKQLCTVVDDHKATRGLIVTTSTFTSVALKYIDTKKYRVAGADQSRLREWMRIVREQPVGR
jgi:hypothetical protein